MRVGLRVPQHVDAERALEFCEKAERLGFSSVWVNDHLVAPHSNPLENQLESWTLLSAIAAVTSKVRLGTLVMCNPVRHPALVAKMASTLDNLSGGRVELGLGAGWKEQDLAMVGLGRPARGNLSQLEEALQVILKLWSQDNVAFEGAYYRMSDGYCIPRPLQSPRPPILLGLSPTRRRSTSVIARYADKYNMLGLSPADYRRKHEEVIAEEARVRGTRSPSAVLSTFLIVKGRESVFTKQVAEAARRLGKTVDEFLRQPYAIVGSHEECVSRLKEYRRFIDEFVFITADTDYEEQLQLIADDVVPKLNE